MNKFLKTRRMMLQKSGATACKILNNTIEQAHILRWFLLLFFAMPHIKRYKKYRLADLLSMTYPQVWNIPLATLCFSMAAAAVPAVRVASSAPKARLRCILRLGTAMPPWSSSWSLRGPRWTRPTNTAVALVVFELLWEWQVMEGVCTLAGDFRFALGCWVVTCC
jgi:hypothetical protein